MRGVLATALLPLLSGSVLAQEDLVIDQSHIYVSDPGACQALENKGFDAVFDSDFLILDFDLGIQSYEFQCSFHQVIGRKGSNQLFVNAICELPGELYPDTMAITPWGDDTIQVVSSNEMMWAMSRAAGEIEPSDNPAGVTIYHRCDNLSEISFD